MTVIPRVNERKIPMATVNQILDRLGQERIRATYGAVGEVLGLPPQSVGRALGNHTMRTSWVVNAKTSEPTGHSAAQKHPDLYRRRRIIKTGKELTHLLSKAHGGRRYERR